jgi:type VI secretion system secreted protein Hcp
MFASVLFAGSLTAASDYLLEIDGIKGESTDERHRGTIEIQSFSWGMSNAGTTTSGGTGGGSGKVDIQDFHFTTKLSKASPQLITACATGRHIKSAKLFVRKQGTEQQDYYVITLSDCLVSSFQQGATSSGAAGGADAAPTESISLYYNSIAVQHTADDGSVTTGTAVRPSVATP